MTRNHDAAGCGCPLITPADWDGTRHRWARRIFISQRTRCLFGTPVDTGTALERLRGTLDRLGLRPAEPRMLLYRPGRFSGEMLLAVNVPEGPVPGECTVFEDTYLVSALHRGMPAGAAPALARLSELAGRSGGRVLHTWLWPVTCRQCAPERGGHLTVALGITGADA